MSTETGTIYDHQFGIRGGNQRSARRVRAINWEIMERQNYGAPGSDWQGTPSLFPSRPCGPSPGPPAAMKNAFADGQSSKSPQFLSGPNGSNPASTVAVAVGGAEVSVGVAGSIGGGVGAGGAVDTVATVGVGGNTAGDGVWVEDASGAGVRVGITTGVGCSAVVAIGAGVDARVASVSTWRKPPGRAKLALWLRLPQSPRVSIVGQAVSCWVQIRQTRPIQPPAGFPAACLARWLVGSWRGRYDDGLEDHDWRCCERRKRDYCWRYTRSCDLRFWLGAAAR